MVVAAPVLATTRGGAGRAKIFSYCSTARLVQLDRGRLAQRSRIKPVSATFVRYWSTASGVTVP